MSLARVKSWAASEVLTAADLNAEFNNILNNALPLISPLTGSLDVNNFRLTNFILGSVTSPAISFFNDANTGVFSSAADTVDITAGGVRVLSLPTVAVGVNFVTVNPAATTTNPTVDATGTDTNISLNLRSKGTGSVLANGGQVATILSAQVFS